MNWIRIAVGITRDPSIIGLSEAVGVSVPTTTGHVVGVLTSMPEGCPTGDLSGVSDATLEQWGLWRGRRGVFASAFRAHLCDAQGFVRSWEKHNGASLRRAQEASDRAKKWREERKANAQRMRTDCVANAPRESLRNETRRDVTTTPETGVAVRAQGTDRPPVAGHPVAYRQQLDELRAAGLPHERAALDALLSHHPAPDVLVLELHATASGLHIVRGANTGRAADIADVMRAVAEMAASAKPFSVSLFRGFVRRVADRPPEPASAEEREAARLARDIAAKQPAVVIEAPRSPEEIEQFRQQREAAMALFRAEAQRYRASEAAA